MRFEQVEFSITCVFSIWMNTPTPPASIICPSGCFAFLARHRLPDRLSFGPTAPRPRPHSGEFGGQSSTGDPNAISTLFNQLGQSLQSVNLSAAQQAYSFPEGLLLSGPVNPSADAANSNPSVSPVDLTATSLVTSSLKKALNYCSPGLPCLITSPMPRSPISKSCSP